MLMIRDRLAAGIVGVSLASVSPAAPQPRPAPSVDAAVASGIAEVKRGDHERGLRSLAAALDGLGPARARTRDAALAHLYMGAAYASQGHATLARDRFEEALRIDKEVRLEPGEFPAPVMEAFDSARKGQGGKKTLLIGAGAAAAGAIAIVAAGSGGSGDGSSAGTPSAPTTGTPPSAGPTPLPGCADNVGPRVSMTFPTDASTISATIVLRATATDNVGVTEVRFYLDERLIGLASAGTSELPWDTRSATNGPHQISARAFDACLNQGFGQPVLVVVRN